MGHSQDFVLTCQHTMAQEIVRLRTWDKLSQLMRPAAKQVQYEAIAPAKPLLV